VERRGAGADVAVESHPVVEEVAAAGPANEVERAVAAQVAAAGVRARDDRVAQPEAEERVDLLVLELEVVIRRGADRDVRQREARIRPRVVVDAGLDADQSVAEVGHAAERVLEAQAEGHGRGADPADADRRPDVGIPEAEAVLSRRRLRERGESDEDCGGVDESRQRFLLSRETFGMIRRRHRGASGDGAAGQGQRALKPGTGPFPWMSDVPWPSSPNWLEPQLYSAPSSVITSACESPVATYSQPLPGTRVNS